MTVKQLIAKLKKLPPTALVILQKDGEGNGYSPLVGADTIIYRADSTWSGEVFAEDDPDYEKESGDKLTVVLWPVN